MRNRYRSCIMEILVISMPECAKIGMGGVEPNLASELEKKRLFGYNLAVGNVLAFVLCY